MFSRYCIASRNLSSQLLFKPEFVQSRSFHVMNNSKLGTNITQNLNVNRDINKHRTILFFGPVRALSVTAVTNASTIPTEIPAVPEIPSIPLLPDAQIAGISEQLVTTLEPTFASIGLGGWSPVGLLQYWLEFLHVSCDLPWWGAIVVSTICMRALLTPLVIIVQRNAAKMSEVMPKMQEIQVKITEARQMGNATDTAMYTQELVQLMAREKVNPLKNMLVPLAQAPIFVSYFICIRQMVNAPVESLQTGGLYWFTDLTLADPYYALPFLTCSTLLLTIHLGVDGMNLNMANGQIIKHVFRAMPIVLFPFIMNFPAAMVVYWSTSNFISLIQSQLLKIPAVRTFCKIPQIKKHDPSVLPIKNKKFIAGVKDSWSNMKLTRELEGRKRLDEINFQRAGSGPLVKTYKFDPTKPRPGQLEKKVA